MDHWFLDWSARSFSPFPPRYHVSSRRAEAKVGRRRRTSHGTQRRTLDNPRFASPKRLSLIGLASRRLPWTSDLSRLRCLFPIGSLQPLLPRPFEWIELCNRRKALFLSTIPESIIPPPLIPRLHTSGEARSERRDFAKGISSQWNQNLAAEACKSRMKILAILAFSFRESITRRFHLAS